MSKNPKEAMDFLSYVAQVSRGWDEPNAREVGRMKSQPNASNAKAGMYTLNESKIYSYGKKIGGARSEENTRSAGHFKNTSASYVVFNLSIF